jgi:hypothetical protein
MSVARTTLLAALPWLVQTVAWGADAPSTGSRWSITPYVWLPTINSELEFDAPPGGGNSVDSEIGPSDYLTNLNGVLMLATELRHDRWAFGGDLIWLDLTADVSTVHEVSGDEGTISIPRDTELDTTTELGGVVVTLTGGTLLVDRPVSSVVAFGGARYLTIEADLDWGLTTSFSGPGFEFEREGKVSGDSDFVDAVVGARGTWRFGRGEHWSVPWYADIGTGSADLTWQAMAGLIYTWQQASVLLVWRHLDYDGEDGDLLREMRLDGPAVGFRWRF